MRMRFLPHGLFGHRFARGEFGPREGRHGGRHGEPGHERGHGRRGGFRPGRFFEHGDLRIVVLALIEERPRHGYDIIKAIEEKAGGAYTPSPGVVYPTLTLLEELGHIAVSTDDSPRKLHSITEDGRHWLNANRAAAEAIFARLTEASPEGGPAPQILRAMENLRLALRLRLGRGRLEPVQVAAIAAALDAAAVAIEQG